MSESPNARSLLLDLLRVVPGRTAVPVQGLVRVGELFGITGNATRVALSRLSEGGLVESDERGQYRLSQASDPVSTFVENWRLGEQRLRPWEGGWLCVHLPRPGPGRKARTQSLRAMEFLSLREAEGGLWVRPDNLAGGAQAAREALGKLGLEEGALVFAGRDFGEDVTARWAGELWTDEPSREQRAHARKLEASTKRIPSLNKDKALVETFTLGGKAIELLVRDALLPDEIRSGEARRELTDAMLAYDVVGRKIWSGIFSALSLQGAPAQVSGI